MHRFTLFFTILLLCSFNIANAALSEVGSYDTDGDARGVAVIADHIFVADGNTGLLVFDVSDPTDPQLVGSLDTPGVAYDILIVGDHAFIADGGSGICVIDISDPTNPQEVGSLDPSGSASNLAFDGTNLFVANGQEGLLIVDISDPTSPQEISSIDTDNVNAECVAVAGEYAYVATWFGGMYVFNISDTSNPQQETIYNLNEAMRGISISGNYVYIGTEYTMYVLDVSDPANPQDACQFDAAPGTGMVFVDDYLFAAGYTPIYANTGLRVIDVSDPTNIAQTDFIASPNNSYDVKLGKGYYAYLADNTSGIHVYDVSDYIPELEITLTYPNGGENFKNDETETITWTITGGGETVETVVSYSIDGGNTWIEIATVAGDVFEYDWTVPELYSVYCLVRVACIDEFYNAATDESDTVFSIETTRYYHWFDRGWTMMSLPLNPYHASPQNVLGDDIDGVWDCFGFGYHTGHYRPDHMFTEQGYWLVLAHEGARVDVRGRANLETVVITLDLPWNMIGSPFPVEVKLWKDVEFRLDGVTYSVYQACEAGLIVPTMWACKPDHKYYIETTTFRPWQGAWFFCLAQDLEMLVSPPSPDPAPAPQRDENEASQDSWELTITAELGDNSHDIAALGSHYEATDAFDLRFDFPKPPAMMESSSITAYFLHEDALDALPDRFNRDMRAVMDDEQSEWTLYVDADEAGEVTLSWSEILNSTPEGYEFTLIDTDARRSIDMLEADDYTYETEGGISEFTVRVIATPYGVEGDASPQAPSEFNLMSAYPNPFNATTTISYDLPYSSDVVVGIYDLSGRSVTTLVSDYQEIGSYTAVWNAEGMAAGIYLIRLSTTEHVVISKVALVK